MMQNKFLLILAFFLTILINSSNLSAEKIKDKPIDLNKFSGVWLEMVRTPNYAQKKCNYSAQNYKISSDSELEITNLCITFDDVEKKTNLHASLIKKAEENNRTFYIEYTALMGFVKPFSKGNFHVFYVNNDYTLAIVGDPDKSDFWVLSRDILNDKEIKDMINLANSLGLDTRKLIFDDFSHETKSDLVDLLKEHN